MIYKIVRITDNVLQMFFPLHAEKQQVYERNQLLLMTIMLCTISVDCMKFAHGISYILKNYVKCHMSIKLRTFAQSDLISLLSAQITAGRKEG